MGGADGVATLFCATRVRGIDLFRAWLGSLLRHQKSRKETPACDNGYTHMDDTRYGRVTRSTCSACWPTKVSANPKQIGVMGGSYGGGASVDSRT